MPVRIINSLPYFFYCFVPPPLDPRPGRVGKGHARAFKL